MFCPKCGSQNADETKFCRGCGVDLSNVLAVVDGNPIEALAMPEKHLDLYSSGIRNLVLATGFLIVSMVISTIPPHDTYFWLLVLLPAFPLLASAVSRIIKARGMKALKNAGVTQPKSLPVDADPALPPGKGEYIKPAQSGFKTDDLAERPLSITESTTRHLRIDSDRE